MFAAGENPILILDDGWRLEVLIALAGIQVAAQRLLDLDPPEGLAEIDGLLNSAARGYIRMATLIAEGLDELNVDKLLEASSVQNSATDELERANQRLQGFCR